MFRKIHSNRDPRDTLFSEFRKEFGNYFLKARNWFSKFASDYSWQLYSCMVVLLGISLIISFSLPIRQKEAIQPMSKTVREGMQAGGFGQVLQTGSALKQTIELKAEIENIIATDSLSAQDSARLEKALDQLHKTNQSLKK